VRITWYIKLKKFAVEDNIKHWDKFAISYKNKKGGATYDSSLSELEDFFIITKLKEIKPRSLFDIGCGDGQRTSLFSRYVKGKTLGIDYSKEMIKQANTIKKRNLFFEHVDINRYSVSEKFDVIVSCRCIINQPTRNAQINLFKKLHKMLKPKGHLIVAEASVEGLANLNELRKKLGLNNIEEHWFNLHIHEKTVFSKISHLYKINTLRRLGLYYYIARVIQPASTFPKEPKRGSMLDELAKKTQVLFFNADTPFEGCGRHLLIDLQKI